MFVRCPSAIRAIGVFVPLSLAFTLSPARPAEAQQYSVTDLGVLPGRVSAAATAINDAGQVVGYSSDAVAVSHAFRYTPGLGGAPGTLLDLGTLDRGSYSGALGINELGQVVGWSDTQNAEPRAFLWRDGAMLDIVGGNGGANIYAVGITDSGRIAGYMTNSGSGNPAKWRAVCWDEDPQGPGQFLQTNLDVLSGGDPLLAFCTATGINASGQISGESFVSDGSGNHAVLWDGDPSHNVVDLPMPQGAVGALANAINDVGAVVGYCYFPFGATRPTMWGATAAHDPIDLGLLPGTGYGVAHGVNNAGQVVGACNSNELDSRAFLYADGVLRDLNELLDASGVGWSLQAASAINASGQIAGWGSHDGAQRAFLLTPTAPTASPSAALPTVRSALHAASPNPFNPRTAIRFDVARPGHVEIAVYDSRGRVVARLADAALDVGSHEVAWDGHDLRGLPAASGVYRVRLTTPDTVDERAITLTK